MCLTIEWNGLLRSGLLALGVGSLLLLREVREGAEDLDLSPLLLGGNRLRLGLEEMQGLAVFLYKNLWSIRGLVDSRNLHDK